MLNAKSEASAPARPRLLLVDGSGYIFRAYHALPPLTRADGTPVGAVYGYTTMLLKLPELLQADYLAVVFDSARRTFRNEIYSAYKANRSEPPEDLVPQFALVREATRALNIPCIELANYEADDLIASYAKAAAAQGMEVVIVSSDKDLMQLIDAQVSLFDPIKQKALGEAQVREKFGVGPERVADVQALIGDAIDNVPGIPGIGPKTAAQLMEQFGTLEEVLRRAGEVPQQKRRESLQQFAEQARLSYELVRLKDDIPLPQPIEALSARPPEREVLLAFLRENGFKALLKRMEGGADKTEPVAPPHPNPLPGGERVARKAGEGETPPLALHSVLIQDMPTLQAWIARAQAEGIVALDTETTSLNAMQAELVGISLCIKPGEACYIPVGHVTSVIARSDSDEAIQKPLDWIASGAERPRNDATQSDLFAAPSPQTALCPHQLPLKEVLSALSPLLSDPGVLKIGQNIKYDMLVLARYGVAVTPFDDTMLLSYCLNAGAHNHNMDELAQRYLNHTPIAYKQVVGSGKTQKNFCEVDMEAARDYAAEDADVTRRLHGAFKPALMQARLVSLYETIERPLIPVIARMERRGIRVDTNVLRQLSGEFAQQMQALEVEIHRLAGRPFNIGSPKQLGEILYDEMGLAGAKKSGKTGAYSTDAAVLEELAAGGHPLPGKVLEWRQLAKLKGTYTDALIEQIHPETGRIHTCFALAATTTGRLSSSDPNLQNIPIRTEAGRRIRTAFVAAEGQRLISADYSQIELRLLAHIADIAVLKAAFAQGADIHAATAAQMFGVPPSQVDGELRRRAKTINFGIIYGISAHGLSTRLGIGRKEAGDYIDAYFRQYPGIKDYMERTKAFAREHGYVETLFGRRVHVKDINARNPNLRAFSERAAINAPLQGTAADIIKRAMIRVDALLSRSFAQAHLLLQVHDELVLEAPAAQAEAVAQAVKTAMQGAAHLSVPLLVEAGIAEHWGAAH